LNDRGHLFHWHPETGDGGLADDSDNAPAVKSEISLDEMLLIVAEPMPAIATQGRIAPEQARLSFAVQRVALRLRCLVVQPLITLVRVPGEIGRYAPMTTVFVLQHEYEWCGRDEVKFVGVYATREDAQTAMGRLSNCSGFRDWPDGLSIEE